MSSDRTSDGAKAPVTSAGCRLLLTFVKVTLVLSCGSLEHRGEFADRPVPLDAEYAQPTVVVVALGSESSFSTEGQFEGGASVRDVQLRIVKAVAPVSPVLLLVDDFEDKVAVETSEVVGHLVAEGSVRVAVVPHDSVWIRDYGPKLRSGDRPVIVDPAYRNTRKELELDEYRAELDEQRLDLVIHLLATLQDAILNDAELPPDWYHARENVDLYAELESVYSSERFMLRTLDDRAGFEIAQTVLGWSGAIVERVPLCVDGGNLLVLTDGRALTTSELLLRNHGRENDVETSLARHYGFDELVVLEPLPGPVIQHVDMMVLPATGGRVLIADYDPGAEDRLESWSALDASLRALSREAQAVMQRNAARLEALGYETVAVPSPYPRRTEGGSVYYPTILNGLVAQDAAGTLHVFLPAYDQVEPKLQLIAHGLVETAFGEGTVVEPIECTEAARVQGGIHCLTTSFPRHGSIFDESRQRD